MSTIQHRTRWVSLIVLISLLIQALLPPASVARAAQPAAPPLAQPTGRSLAGQANQLEQSLVALEQAADAAALQQARSRVAADWNTLLEIERETSADLAAQEQELAARGLQNARSRQADHRSEHMRQLNSLKGRYQALTNAQSDRQANKNAAAALRTALAESLKAATAAPPKLDLMPNRPAPTAQPVKKLPAYKTRSSSSDQASDSPVAYRSSTTLASEPLTTAEATVAAIGAPPVAADLAPTQDAAITPEIQALADELGRDPTRIYEYVRNKISFEPYYGSRKGALLTLWERSGNDIDTASLLIALLRASGFHARYVEGTVAVDGVRARNWVGNAPNLSVAGSILATGGVPVGLTSDGYLIKEHVWVEVFDPNKTFVDFNGNGRVDVGDIQTVARQLNTTIATYDFDRDGTVDVDDVQFVAARWKQPVQGGGWLALDASFKQFTYRQPLNTAAITGFDAENWVEEVADNAVVNDAQQSIATLPTMPVPADADDHEAGLSFADAKAADAADKMMAYIKAHPDMTNADLLGGAYIITETVATLPSALPLEVLPTEPIAEYSEVPAARRDYVTVELYDTFGNRTLSHRASFPSLANQRVTISYEAATANDQAVINSYGGSLLTTPPVVDLVPVLRVGGTQVARGSAAAMGEGQTRSLTFTDANGRSSTVQNSISVGETFAVGLAYGRTSADAIAASQERLAAARNALPKDSSGNPDINAPGNMGEPVVGEMLHLSLQAYFNQLDSYSEVVARGQDVRWFRYLSAGTGIQNLIFGYCFGGPCQTRGGGQTFDIQQNVVSALSLNGQPNAERRFLQSTGYFGSALEHSLFGDLGKGAVSSIRLLSIALQRNIPVYRINSTNKAAVFPLLQLDSGTESYISQQIDSGKVVTVSQRPLTIEDWSGVGYIVMDPSSGGAAYLISGGLFGETRTINGGSLWDILKTIAAYAWLAINMGLDLWGIWAGIGLLLVPEPTLLTKLAGIGLIAANLAALGFDIADLWSLATGEKSAQEYIGEQITGLIVEALLKRLGIAAAAEIVRRLGPDSVSTVVRQLSRVTGGVSDQMLARGFSQTDIVNYSSRLTTQAAWSTMNDVGQRYGDDVVRTLMNNTNLADGAERIARNILDAPNAPGIQRTIDFAISRNNYGYAYELQRAVANKGTGVVGYGQTQAVTFQRVVGLDASGNPILAVDAAGNPVFDTQLLEGDLVLSGNIWVDAKHGPVGNQDLRIWNQIQKGQAALNQGLISGYRFEASSSMGAAMRTWAATNAPGVQFLTNLGDGYP